MSPEERAAELMQDAIRNALEITRGWSVTAREIENEIVKHIREAEAAAFKRGLEAAAKIADADPECPGDMPEEAREAALNDPEGWSRATVRATKKSIARSIRARAKESTDKP